MKSVKILPALAAFLCSAASFAADPATVDKIDVPRYMGVWHEIARLPMRYQDQCVAQVQAHYTLQDDQSVKVVNSCRDKDGKISSIEGQAKADDASGSKLHVTFLPKSIRWLPIGKAPYWVLRIDEGYRHALVGTPNRKYLWILSRTPQMDDELLRSYIDSAKAQGYDTTGLIRNPQ